MLWVRGCVIAVAGVGAMTTSAWAQSQPPCTFGSFPFVYAATGASIPAKVGAPFSAIVSWTFDHQLPDGNAIHAVEWTTQARDSAGRTRTERAQGCTHGEDGQLHARTDVTIYDPATRTTTFWTTGFPSGNLANVTHRPAPVANPAPAPRPAPTADEQAEVVARQKLAASEQPPQGEMRNISLGIMTINGVSATGSRSVRTIAAGLQGNELAFEIVREYWVSKDLNLTVESIFDNPMTGRSAFELQNINLQEPDPSLFQIPAGYTVKDLSPAQASTPSPTQASAPSSTQATTQASTPSSPYPYPCSDVTRHITDPHFARGQHWGYQTRPEDVGSTLYIMEIDQVPELGVVVWVSVDHFHIPALPMGAGERFASGGFAVTRDALEASGIQLIDSPPVIIGPNYGAWVQDCVAQTHRVPIADMLNEFEHKQCQDNATRIGQDPSQCPSRPRYPASTPPAFSRPPLTPLAPPPTEPLTTPASAQSAPAKPPCHNPDASGKYRIGCGVSAPGLIHKVEPQFPAGSSAKDLRSGAAVSLVVDAEGNPTNVHLSHSMVDKVDRSSRARQQQLEDNVLEAVKQYRFPLAR